MSDDEFNALAGQLAAARSLCNKLSMMQTPMDEGKNAEATARLMMAEARRDKLSWRLRKAAEDRVAKEFS